ncbi:MAG: SPFH domain-containing protein [Candidatus Zixiibacteriota bacterium]|nr:MAG: SPFH domain-containing protein [candidate division Zixibacteria bacterium]
MIKEREREAVSGWIALIVLLVLLAAAIWFFFRALPDVEIIAIVWIPIDLFLLAGLFMINPNEGRVLQLFGKYVYTAKNPGLRWANPLYTKKHVSLRVRNFETGRMKVNDIDGNPIEIAAIVVWKVIDTAEACFQVDNYVEFVSIQSEAAVRNLATQYHYDASSSDQVSLRGSTADISEKLREEIQERLQEAGVHVIEARISHLAYAPEIAEAMLRRQQAGAIVAARQLIVEGAVGMVEMALEQLSEKNIIELDHERKASMVSNLLVVLCGETATQPVINTGTLYQ